MGSIRTDLADEAKALFEQSAGKTTRLAGVAARDYRRGESVVTAVDVLDERGASALGKPVGRYRTLALPNRLGGAAFAETVRAAAQELKTLLPSRRSEDTVLVAGLGNPAVTPDALGPLALNSVLVTRHLRADGGPFGKFTSVAAAQPGVLGATGMESGAYLAALTAQLHPAFIVAVDAQASCRAERLCAVLGLSDAGLTPGSGVGNRRMALDQKALGVPVVAVGVPTVIDAAAWMERGENAPPLPALVVTPADIDERVRRAARLIGYAIDLALHPFLTVEDLTALLE